MNEIWVADASPTIVILRARREEKIASAGDLLRELRAAGLYLDDAVARTALAGIGESWD